MPQRNPDIANARWCQTLPAAFLVSGDLGLRDVLGYLRNRIERGLWSQPVFIDARRATLNFTLPDIDELLQAVQRMSISGPPARTALLMSNPLDYGIARIYVSFASQIDPDFAVFHDADLAMGWLENED